MTIPIFVQVEYQLWQWGDWFIAYAYGRFWLLTSSGDSYGPYRYFGEALEVAGKVAA